MEIEIKKNDKGYFIELEYKKKLEDDTTYFRKKRKIYLDSNLSPTKRKLQANILYLDFLDKCEEEYKENLETKEDILLKKWIEIYLESIKTSYSLNYYKDWCLMSQVVIKELGKYKLQALTPIVIQRFCNKLKDMKSIKIIVVPKKEFNTIIKNVKYKREAMKNINNSHNIYFKRASQGKPVSEKWAKDFASFLKIPFEKMFDLEKEEKELSYVYKKRHYTFLRACLAEAKRKMLVKENYAKSEYVTLFKNPTPNKEKNVLNKEDFLKLYNYVLKLNDITIKSFFATIMNTGARKEEILGLKWENINFTSCEITFENTVTYIATIGVVINEAKTKNASSYRTVKVSNELISVLKEFKAYKIPEDDNKWLFEENGTVISPFKPNKWLNNILNALNLPHYNIHSLRHSYTSIMINYMPIAEISKRIGHSEISTTLNVYTHSISKDQKFKDLEDIINNKNNPLKDNAKALLNANLITKDEYNRIISTL